MHCCDNPKCVNPDHLFLGTIQDNVTDMISKGRQRDSGVRGEAVGQSKLTDIQVRVIRRYYPLLTQTKLAEIFNVSPKTISSAVNRQTWAHVL